MINLKLIICFEISLKGEDEIRFTLLEKIL